MTRVSNTSYNGHKAFKVLLSHSAWEYYVQEEHTEYSPDQNECIITAITITGHKREKC